ncbi:MAG: hypothetical protein QUS08_04935, partial [Methanothrix sp.]|nr:hypothetical protein [Methanothrix sp.]
VSPGPIVTGDTVGPYYADYIVKPEDLNKPSIKNVVVAIGTDPDGLEIYSDPAEAEVKVIKTPPKCYLNKTADKKVVNPGDYITYNITWYCPDAKEIVDYYPSAVSFISATPAPDEGDNKWVITSSSGTIMVLVQVAQDIGNTTFDMGQDVKGIGFVNIHSDICTSPALLRNKVILTRNDGSKIEALSDVSVGPPQTCASLREAGSGQYSSEDVIRYRNSNRTIEWNKSLRASYLPTSFSLPRDRGLNYTTRWIEKARAKNYATGASMSEEYTHAKRISRDSSLQLDENGSILTTEADFEGSGHIGLLKTSEPNATVNATTVFEASEDYVGSFRVHQRFDEYGQNVEYERSVSGEGLVAARRDLGPSRGHLSDQASYESGTGSYSGEERISTVVNYIAKNISLEHAPAGYAYTPDVSIESDLKWKEGMYSKTPTSLIGEEFSSAERLQKDTVARGLNEMQTEASFSGQARFRTVYKSKDTPGDENLTTELDSDEQYLGDYAIKRMTRLGGVAKYNRPHISLRKESLVDLPNTTFVDYRITIENNGNRALGPVYVKDTFPEGTEYIYSSLRPAELTSEYVNWSLVSLGIGSRAVIDLRLNITEEPDSLVNRVEAAGMYDGRWVTARNFTVDQLHWLSCCPPQIRASKAARVDAQDPEVVWYRLDIENRASYTMVAFLIDHLPGGMQLLNASLDPSENSSTGITWTILDLHPGETRTITYRARAAGDGSYLNAAHIEAFSVDGPDFAVGDVSVRVDIGEAAARAREVSGWQPPECFGLNCSSQIPGDDWVPCYTCGRSEPSPIQAPCSSCVSAGDDIP